MRAELAQFRMRRCSGIAITASPNQASRNRSLRLGQDFAALHNVAQVLIAGIAALEGQ
ncbi:hypothetical protein XA26_06080 [Mycolicibacterium fortuitum]|uniref:Uncharacterized protein n=1 Tax=Mycolicibacterium fortuitum TaxID=1766 RepID=A0A0N9YBX1_MYCFO|nr:hypothetical protein XA26_06080 [Mycolicibacterium fortuitum]